MYEEISNVIIESGIFDEDYYLKKYEDIKRRNNDALRHYIRHGYKEGRNPNAFFDGRFYRENYLDGDKTINPLYHYLTSTKALSYKTSDFFDGDYYLKRYPDVLKSGMNPLVHYLVHGLNEGRKAVELAINPSHQRIADNVNVTNVAKKRISIIIPVFNAYDEVQCCIDSVISHTPLSPNLTVIVLNDRSSDKRIKPMLGKYKNIPNVQIKNNRKNLGYTRNVNKGAKLAEGRDIILLNSDTVVTPNWVRNLTIAAYNKESIGTVTAVSNNAGAFSVPKAGTNDIPAHLDITAISRIVKSSGGTAIDVPTGNGFCLYIKRALIDEIGYFDHKKFPRGYGEENDFCMRAIESGWTNIVDTKTYIYHKRSASFKEAKSKLIEAGVKQVKVDFPEYAGAIRGIGGSEEFKKAREAIADDFESYSKTSSITKTKVMFVISTRTGGTPQTNLDLMRQLSEVYDCYALASNSEKVEVLKAGEVDYETIESHKLSQPVKYSSHRSSEYESLVRYLLFKYNIQLLHIRHIAWHSLLLPEIARSLLIPVVKSFHDFYTICPSVNLVDGYGIYHPNGVGVNSPNPLWKDETVTPMSSAILNRWQQKMDKALSVCDHFITTCDSAKALLTEKLELVSKKNCFTVIPHGRDFDSFMPPVNYPKITQKFRILVPGNIGLAKGAELIKKVKTLDKDGLIEFHIIGSCNEDLIPYVKYHGRYEREQFQELVATIQPHISAVFSIWPETFCHTLTESWAAGLPVLGVAYGAVENRIKKHKAGWLIKNDAQECYSHIIHLISNANELMEKQNAVLAWQRGEGIENTIGKMTEEYISIYQSLLKPINTVLKKKLGFIMKGSFPEVPPTAYVRLVDWKEEFEKDFDLEVEFTEWDKLLTNELFRFKHFIIQRDAIPNYAVDWCIQALKRFNISYTFEIDDNLLEVPKSVDPAGVYDSYRPFLVKMLTNAEAVHVTNDALRNVIMEYNSNVSVRPNRIFEKRWQFSISDIEKIGIEKNGENFSILYFGSRTHQEDLDFLIEVVKKLQRAELGVHLYVVGCGEFNDEGFVTRLIPPSSRYDHFIEWLKKISHNFDLGVAPLLDPVFSTNKSYLKALEFNALNMRVICSDVMPYSELKKEQTFDISYAKNDVCEWVAQIKNNLIEGD